jgi:hypothetical protein
VQDQGQSIARRVDLIRRRAQRDPVAAAADAILVLRELHGGGGPDGPYSDLWGIRARGVAQVAWAAGLERHQRRLARAEGQRNPERRAQLLADLQTGGVEPYWSVAARRFSISHTQAAAWGEPGLDAAEEALGSTPAASPLSVVGPPP